MGVGHVIALIAGTPFLEAHVGTRAMQRLDAIEQVAQADGIARSAADVECLSGDAPDVPLGEQERVDEVLDEQDVAHLHAVAV